MGRRRGVSFPEHRETLALWTDPPESFDLLAAVAGRAAEQSLEWAEPAAHQPKHAKTLGSKNLTLKWLKYFWTKVSGEGTLNNG